MFDHIPYYYKNGSACSMCISTFSRQCK